MGVATNGMYGPLKSAWNNLVTVRDEGLYGLGKIIGEKGAESTVVLATEGTGRYIREIRLETMRWEVINKTWEFTANNQAPATVGTMAITGDAVITPSGKWPNAVAPNLAKEVEKVGKIGEKVNGNTLGCCAEFHGANRS